MDLSASLTSNGSINIVTRSGGNAYHGSGFYFYRDHNLAAYPGLQRDASNPDPFFQRRQFGYQLGGPIRKDRAFLFTSYERNDQRGVLSIQPATPEFAPLGGDSRFFGPNDGRNPGLPSNWSRVTTWADQSLAALTSVLSPRLVNDVRFSYFFFSTPEAPANTEDCPGCLGVDAPRINIPDAGVVLGGQQSSSFVGRRYQITESLAWQKGDHRLGVHRKLQSWIALGG
jgi:hypothetical protein